MAALYDDYELQIYYGVTNDFIKFSLIAILSDCRIGSPGAYIYKGNAHVQNGLIDTS
jgi:hypothetical protein